MQLKNSCNNTKVFNHPWVGKKNALTDFLLAQKKMAELEPLSLVVMEHNTAIDHQDRKEVPHPLQHILHVLSPNNGALLSQKLLVSSTSHEGLLEFFPSLERNDDHSHWPHSLQQQKPH
jgi:hypothetical protein